MLDQIRDAGLDVPEDLTVADLVTNEFVDPYIGLTRMSAARRAPALRLTMTAAIHARFAHRVDGLVHSHPWSVEATVEGPADADKVMPADDLEAAAAPPRRAVARPVPHRHRRRRLEGLRAAGLGARADGRGDRPPAVGPAGRRRCPGWCRSASSSRRSSTAAARCACRSRPDRWPAPPTSRSSMSPRCATIPTGSPRSTAVERIGAACSRSGFFVVVGHGLDAELVDVFAAARRFFALPRGRSRSDRRWSATTATPASGRPAPDGKEMLDIGLAGFDRWPDARRVPGRRRALPSGGAGGGHRPAAGAGRRARHRAGFFADRMRQPAVLPAPAALPGRRPTSRPAATPTTGRSRCWPPTAPGLEVRPARTARGSRSRRRRAAWSSTSATCWPGGRTTDTCRHPTVSCPPRSAERLLDPVLRQPRPGDRGRLHPDVRDARPPVPLRADHRLGVPPGPHRRDDRAR